MTALIEGSNAADSAGDIARCIHIISTAYAFADGNIRLEQCGEWNHLKRLLSAPQKPAPDAMREATQAQHVGRPKGEPAKFVRNGKLEICQCLDCRTLSAPVPPPDGAHHKTWWQNPDPWPQLDDDEATSTSSPGAAEPDDVRSALADEMQAARDAYLNGMGMPGDAERRNILERLLWDNKAEIVAALRSAPVSAAPPDGVRSLIVEACDLLAERKQGNPARSAGHNARLALEAALRLLAAPPVRDREAIARALWVSRGGKPENFDRHWKQQRNDLPSTSLYPLFQDCVRDADAILSLPVQSGAGEREALSAAAEWCRIAREKIGAVDGYDYRSGEEFGLRRAQIELEHIISRQPPHSSSDGEGR